MSTKQMIRKPKTKRAIITKTPNKTTGSGTSSNSSASVSAKRATKSQTQSALLIKRLLASAISEICYQRAVFPRKQFIDKVLPGKGHVKILKPGRDGKLNREAILLLQFMSGIFDAMDKKYLRAVLFGLSCDKYNMDVVEEYYTFRFEYTERGEPMMAIDGNKGDLQQPTKKATAEETKQSVRKVMTRLSSIITRMESLRSRPHMIMKLLYYDERTPADYEPPNFKPTDKPDFDFSAPIVTQGSFGKAETRFHAMKFGITSALSIIDGMEPA